MSSRHLFRGADPVVGVSGRGFGKEEWTKPDHQNIEYILLCEQTGKGEEAADGRGLPDESILRPWFNF
jgi:hypothetical protein